VHGYTNKKTNFEDFETAVPMDDWMFRLWYA